MKNFSNMCVKASYISKHTGTEWLRELDDRFRIVWLKSGSVTLIAGGVPKKVVANQMLFLKSGQAGCFCPDEEMEAYLLCFSEDFLLITGGQENNPFSLHYPRRTNELLITDTSLEMSGIFESMMKLSMSDVHNGYFTIEIFKGVIQVLAGYFSRNNSMYDLPAELSSADENLFENFIKLLNSHYITKKSVMEYARALAVTPNHLSEVVRRVSGSTPSFYIHQRIIREAKRAAHGPRASMKEVAYCVGFRDIAHFSKYFRNQTGMNFTEYRKLLA
jgi:AraC-like DNA-binding protein